MKIAITPRSFSKAGKVPYELLAAAGYEVKENNTGHSLNEDQMIEFLGDCVGVIVGVDPLSRRVLESLPHLKAISKYGAGLDNVDLEAAKELGIAVERAAGANSRSVAELAIGLAFAVSRGILFSGISTRKNGWERKMGYELTGKTMGIVGLGAIGKEVARMAHGLGMTVLGYDPYVSSEDPTLKSYDVKVTTLEEIYAQGDFISLHSPLTEETRHMIDSTSLSKMKKTTFLMNTSRGELVDEDALYDALVSGQIAGAAEDVFSIEPAGDHKLLSLDNFILTPHAGAFTKEATERTGAMAAQNLIDLLK